MNSFEWNNLITWYRIHGRHDLPWRNYTTSDEIRVYRVWLSEILLQQTQASRVVGFFDRMMMRFPTIHDLAHTDYETFFPHYSGLGYYSRARNILKTAKIVSTEYAGIFPKDNEGLRTLPGIGPYTAQAIQAFGYGLPVLSWDTNLEKVFARYYKGSRDIRLNKEEREHIQDDLESFLKTDEKVSIRDINNALMDFSSLVDLKEKSRIFWESYPLQNSLFYRERGANEEEKIRLSQSFPTPDATIIVTLHKDHKVYYSPPANNPDERYAPFILPPSLTRNTREYVKRYFLESYGLHLSVRPAHKKWISEDGRPYIAVNAQVQVGAHQFIKWEKNGGKLED